MRPLALNLAVIMILVGFSVTAPAATKVFLLAGQSNMAGVGGYSGYLPANTYPWTDPPYGQPPFPPCPAPYNQPLAAVQFWNYAPDLNPGGYEIQPGAGNGWIPLQNGYGSLKLDHGPQFGPELSFGAKLHELYPNDEIYLVKYARGGTSLANQWNPSTGSCYTMFKSRVQAAMANLAANGKNPTIAGMIWMQGEDDSVVASYAQAYQTNLQNLVAGVRSDFGVAMKFVAGRISYMGTRFGGTTATCNQVRNAQWNISSYVSNASCIDTDGLQWAYWGHFGTQGQIDLGNRFAAEFAPVPEPSTLVLTGTGLLILLGSFCRRMLPRHVNAPVDKG
jgi:hypothetical protein